MKLETAIGIEIRRMLGAIWQLDFIVEKGNTINWDDTENKSIRYFAGKRLNQHLSLVQKDFEYVDLDMSVPNKQHIVTKDLIREICEDYKTQKQKCVEKGQELVGEILTLYKYNDNHFDGQYDSDDVGYPFSIPSEQIKFSISRNGNNVAFNSIEVRQYNDGEFIFEKVDLT